MKSLRALLIAGLCGFAAETNAAVLLTDFGTGSFSIFDKGNFTSSVQFSNSLNIIGQDFGPALSGGFGAANITGQANTLTLTGTANSVPATTFSIALVDSSLNEAVYTAGSWSSLTTSGSVLLPFDKFGPSNTSSFNFANVIGLNLSVGGTGSPINATLNGLTASSSAVPEPGRALLLLMGFASLMRRRRRA